MPVTPVEDREARILSLAVERGLLTAGDLARAEAVHAAHRHGLVHRDIKPANILIERTPAGALKSYVLDFGLARELAAPGLTLTGMVLGTPSYMAPEQARGDNDGLDQRSDIWSLGATLYDSILGRPPFTGSMLDVLVKLAQGEPERMPAVLPAVPLDAPDLAPLRVAAAEAAAGAPS